MFCKPVGDSISKDPASPAWLDDRWVGWVPAGLRSHP